MIDDAHNFVVYLDIVRGYNKTTIEAYKRYLTRFLIWCESRRIYRVQDITYRIMKDYLLYTLDRKGVPATYKSVSCVRCRMHHRNHIYEDCMRYEIIDNVTIRSSYFAKTPRYCR